MTGQEVMVTAKVMANQSMYVSQGMPSISVT